jgi:hypothetical protein
MFFECGKLDVALLNEPVFVAEDSGEVGQKSFITSRGTRVVTGCGGPARCCASGLQGGQVRLADDFGALVRQIAAEIRC